MTPLRVAVLGAGTMGAGIAQATAVSGHTTTLCDMTEELLERGRARIEASLAKAVARAKLEPADADATRARLTTTTQRAAALATADVVIEAVPENMELKQRIFAEIDIEAPEAWLLGSNTSSLSVTEIASATTRPERVMGLHFFNPPPIMKLVELIRGELSDTALVKRAEDFVRSLGKSPVTVIDAPGFATSRLGLTIGLEAIRMVEQGIARPDAIDTAMELGYRHPMGPLKTGDYVGLDIRLDIAEHLCRELGEAFRPPLLLRRMVRAGRLGRKSGEGFYRWDQDGRCLGPSEAFA
jgi:3-hydroxybutyryl-CoA dehydrogenase